MTKEVAEIVSDLMKVGALIPEPKLSECLDAHEFLLDSIREAGTLAHAFLFSPSEDMKNWDIARIDGQRQLTNSLSGQGYIPKRDAEAMQVSLQEAIDAIKRSDWLTAADRLQRYSTQIGTSLPMWHKDCACVKKGDIVAGIHYGIDAQKDIDYIRKNVMWQDIIAALNRHGILTSEEADKLVKEISWQEYY